MREIKFRAWDGEKMLSVMELNFCEDSHRVLGSGMLGDWYCLKDKLTLMQYTGLKDKNGKEIYEGDIIRSSFGFVYGYVIFKDGSFITRQEREIFQLQDQTFMCDVNLCSTEIIGNIYENPELIERSKK